MSLLRNEFRSLSKKKPRTEFALVVSVKPLYALSRHPLQKSNKEFLYQTRSSPTLPFCLCHVSGSVFCSYIIMRRVRTRDPDLGARVTGSLDLGWMCDFIPFIYIQYLIKYPNGETSKKAGFLPHIHLHHKTATTNVIQALYLRKNL